MDRKQLIVESNVLIALFKATVDQSATLINELKQKPKKEFNEWMRAGWRMMNEFEKNELTNADYLEQLSGVYHMVNADVKEQLEKSLTEVK